MQGANFSQKSLSLLANFTQVWPGRKIGHRKLATITNETGSAPPLVWIFNCAGESPALAAALGPDQPLIALRSLNAVVRIDKLITWDERMLAQVYAEEIQDYLGTRPLFIGGNCQGAAIASEVARVLLLSGHDIRGFAAMEWVDLAPLPLQSTLIFGAESERHNPFLRSLDPRPMWQRIYVNHHIGIHPGEHGHYFTPEHIPDLALHLQTALAAIPEPRRAQQAAAVLTGLPKSVRANQVLILDAGSADGLDPEDGVVFLWDSNFSCLPHREIAQVIAHQAGMSQLRVKAPATPGIWTLQTFRCRSGHGPIAWAEETRTYHRIEVFGDGEPVEFVDAGR